MPQKALTNRIIGAASTTNASLVALTNLIPLTAHSHVATVIHLLNTVTGVTTHIGDVLLTIGTDRRFLNHTCVSPKWLLWYPVLSVRNFVSY